MTLFLALSATTLATIRNAIAAFSITGADGDASFARNEEIVLPAVYCAQTADELRLATTIRSCSVRAFDIPIQAVAKHPPQCRTLRLHPNGVNLQIPIRPLSPIAELAKNRGITLGKAYMERERKCRLAARLQPEEAKAAAANGVPDKIMFSRASDASKMKRCGNGSIRSVILP